MLIQQSSFVPDFLYGTAWKEERTPVLTELALRMGFRGIDTANRGGITSKPDRASLDLALSPDAVQSIESLAE